MASEYISNEEMIPIKQEVPAPLRSGDSEPYVFVPGFALSDTRYSMNLEKEDTNSRSKYTSTPYGQEIEMTHPGEHMGADQRVLKRDENHAIKVRLAVKTRKIVVAKKYLAEFPGWLRQYEHLIPEVGDWIEDIGL
jgi:hypothetical protein